MGKSKYQTEEERKAARREYLKRWKKENPEYLKQWKKENPEKIKEHLKRWYQENKEKMLEQHKEYRNTPIGRAGHLVMRYKQNDKKYNRGECTLTAQWIVDNIFSKPCHYNCGETDWTKLGCDRIDNSLPHTPDNVVPCCDECNKKRGTKTYEEFLMTLKNEQPN